MRQEVTFYQNLKGYKAGFLKLPSDFVIEEHHRVCSQHFLYGNKLQADINARFGSLPKRPAPNRLSSQKQLKNLMKEKQVRITREEVDWRGIAESLSEENKELRAKVVVSQNFSVDDIKSSDKWVSFYTGFQSYAVFQAFYQFLLPAAENLNYYRSESEVKAFRFGLSVSTVPRPITTWICLLHDYLAKLTWWPSE